MAYTPYFRYRTNSLNLGGLSGPVFPVSQGMRAHTYPTEKREYTNTERYHATTQANWRTENIQKTARDTIWTFWDTTLSKGYHNVTAIDNRSRMLFDASWHQWAERWRKERGGIYNIDYSLEAPVPWTPPVWGCWPSITNDLTNHNLSGDDLTLDDGAMTTHASDSNVLRENGYALKMTGTAGTETGAAGTISWESGNRYGSITLFCQFRACNLGNRLYLVEIEDTVNNHDFAICCDDSDASNNKIYGFIENAGNTAVVYKSDSSYVTIADDTWYDIAVSFDDVNNDVRLYYAASPATSAAFSNFLSGETDIEEGIVSTLSSSYYPPRARWNKITLLRESAAGALANTESCYLQNVFVINDFITPVEFNTLRRLCYGWNKQTTGSWPA